MSSNFGDIFPIPSLIPIIGRRLFGLLWVFRHDFYWPERGERAVRLADCNQILFHSRPAICCAADSSFPPGSLHAFLLEPREVIIPGTLLVTFLAHEVTFRIWLANNASRLCIIEIRYSIDEPPTARRNRSSALITDCNGHLG